MKKAQLQAIIAEVEAEVEQLLKSEASALAKGDGDADKDDAPPAEASSPAASPASDAPPAAEASSPAPDAPDAPPADAAPAQDAPPADPASAQDASAPMDVDSLKAEYAKLPPEELKMHFLACKAAMFDSMGGQDEASAGAPPAPPAPAASPAAPPDMMGKAELKVSKEANGGMAKSEDASENAELKKQVELLTKSVELLLTTPQRKAITGVSYLGKSEASAEKKTQKLSKSEISQKLADKARGELKKSDRDLINDYCYGRITVEKIEHLLD